MIAVFCIVLVIIFIGSLFLIGLMNSNDNIWKLIVCAIGAQILFAPCWSVYGDLFNKLFRIDD